MNPFVDVGVRAHSSSLEVVIFPATGIAGFDNDFISPSNYNKIRMLAVPHFFLEAIGFEYFHAKTLP